MKKSFSLCLLAVLIVFASQASHAALNGEQQAYLDKAQTYLNDTSLSYKSYAVDMCGYDIPTKIDPSLVEPFMKAGAELKNYCEEVRTKVALICRDGSADLQAKVKKNIKTISCRLAKTPNDISFQFAKGNLEASFGAKASDIDQAVLKFIENGMSSPAKK